MVAARAQMAANTRLDALQRIPRILLRVLLAGLSCAAALVLAEWLVRRTDAYGVSYYRDTNRYINEAIELLPADSITASSRIFQNRPGCDLELRTFRFATDGLGLRASDGDAPAPALGERGKDAPLRILFLGDSVTLAWGVDDAASWVRTLERSCSAPDGRDLECLNAGHLQYNTVQEADLLEAIGPVLAPDAVVVTFVANDVTDEPFATFERFMQDVAAHEDARGWTRWVGALRARVLSGFRGLHGLWVLRRNLAAEDDGPAPIEALDGVAGFEEGWRRCESGLARLAAAARTLGVPLIVLDHGKPRVDAVRRWCEQRGVPWHDFTFTDEEWSLGLRNSAADAHANALGNRLLAVKAARALAEADLVDPDCALAEWTPGPQR